MLVQLKLGQTNFLDSRNLLNKHNSIDHSNSKFKTIIFIHGNSHDLNTFNEFFKRESFKNYRLVSYDLFGHGKSDKVNKYNFQVFKDQLIQLIEKLKIKDYYICGHSLGGHIAIQSFESLSGCQGIFTFGTPPMIKPLTSSPFNDNPSLSLLSKENLTEDDARKIQKMFYNDEDTHNPFEVKTIINTDKLFRTQFMGSILAGNYLDEKSIILRSKNLIKVNIGEKDGLINQEYMKEVLGDMFKIIKTAPHNIHLSKPCLLETELFDFIK